MSSLESISFSFSLNPLIIIIGALLISIYVYYVYKYTVPKVSPVLKYFLFAARFLALILILFILFEPILSIEFLDSSKTKNLIFIDNSKSIIAEDSSNRVSQLNNFKDQIKNFSDDGIEYLMFGNNVKLINKDSLEYFNNSESSTNLSRIFDYTKTQQSEVGSIVIVSDGIITEGSNPVYAAEQMGVPIFTVGIGDSTDKKDVKVNKLLHNEYIYSNQKTSVEAVITHNGFNNKSINVEFSEDNKLVSQKSIVLSESGINRLNFDYEPKSAGEKKISVKASTIPGEAIQINNSANAFIKVLDKKVNVLIVSGSPSPDLSFIKNTLSIDENISAKSIIQISKTNFLEEQTNLSIIDSADILFLVGFPSKISNTDFLQKVEKAISIGKPFFLVLSAGTDLQKLNNFNSHLPFTVTSFTNGFTQVQPEIIDINNTLIKRGTIETIDSWNNLPPVDQPRFQIAPKPESLVIAKSKFRGTPTSTPLIISRSVGSSRSIAVIAKNIWKWKLNSENSNHNLFDSFIKNSVEWLNADTENPQVIVKTLKREYTLGESIEFTAQVYDENFNPINNADLLVSAFNNGNNFKIQMNSLGNGVYEGYLESSVQGIYNYSGKAVLGSKMLGESKGKFEINSTEIEKINLKMNKGLLRLLANTTGGRYFDIQNSDELPALLNRYTDIENSGNTKTTEINLWSDSRFLILIIILLGIEWFFRKRAGML
jgi:hypothetical protein